MLYNVCFYFLLFIIYCFIGYILEIISVSLIEKKLVLNRGFLIGPCLPIYGLGALTMVFFLERYNNDLLVLFIMGTVICTTLEYLTSLLMEKIFHLRWWDYSNKSFNINGRVCLENGVMFGIGGVLVIKIVNPFLEGVLYSFPSWLTLSLSLFFFIIFFVDVIFSIYIMFRLKINASKYIGKDATPVIKEEIRKALSKNTIFITRLLGAFPHINQINGKEFFDFNRFVFKTRFEYDKEKTERRIRELKGKIKTENRLWKRQFLKDKSKNVRRRS